MTSDKIYPIFKKKIERKPWELISSKSAKEEIYRVIISFDNINDREEFITNYLELDILRKFDLISAVCLSLTKEEILKYQDEALIKLIEEDQKLYLSILEINKIIKLNEYRKSQYFFTGNNITIGIIDNGINQDFDSLWDIVKETYKLSDKSKALKKDTNKKEEITHGSLMASIIGNQYLGYDDNIIGIAPNASLIDLNISNDLKEYYISDILEIVDIIITNKVKMDLLLISFTTLEPSDGRDILSLVCNDLVERGTIVVSPAGNFGPESYTIGSPGAAEKVITIGSLTKELSMAYFSGRGPTLDERMKPDFCLPGSKVNIPLSNNVRIDFSGTSVSAAIGVSIIALLKEYNPKISYEELREILEKVCTTLNYEEVSQGLGTLNVMNLFKKLDLYQEKVLTYKYLGKRALKFSIESISIFIVIFFLVYFYNLY